MFKDCIINKDFVNLTVSSENSMSITISENIYENIIVSKDMRILSIYAPYSDISISEEVVKQSIIDDLYTIKEAKDIMIQRVTISDSMNTNDINDTSAIFLI